MDCRSTRGKPLNRYEGSDPETVCLGCPLVATKAEALDPQILQFAEAATRLAELNRGGAQFDYPNALTAAEWAAIAGLTRGRERAQEEIEKNNRRKR